ncbi:Alpha/Beta hydrolase protein [Dactylonectria macrodidyma]|uniref:Carboxylic ester hydrolase n=1 Tax=Dactylonectria macrodidyma TaxID=307937 RepID=A0A9P9DJR3_9HYPO|nr:Alpha/Beta hydrolase protein [Dactylonectria macrodidyma]
MGNHISYTTSECQAVLQGGAGTIKGLQFDKKSRRFAGVPYAEPPVGDLRWRRPQPLPESHSYSSPDGTPYDATAFGPVCPQANYSKTVSEHIPIHVYDEDCLRLNIWTPVADPSAPHKKWPVVIWFHGGWFQVGDPSQEESMDPTELISTGNLQAVFVAVGYRLNVFGFLAGRALLDESGGEAVGNYGLWDQRLAMDWVYDNIASFGGDPDNIVLAGRSAGAYSVLAQALHDFRIEKPTDRFRRLIMYSNAIPTQPKTTEECEPQFDELCAYFNVPSDLSGAEKLRRLRAISAKDLCAGIMNLQQHTFRPVTDNLFIHAGIFSYYRSGSFAAEFKKRGLQLYIGEVQDENTLYAVTNGPDANAESLQLQIANYYPPATTERLLRHYGLPTSEDKKEWETVFGQIVADGQVRAPSRYLANNLLEHGVDINHVWRYLIAYRLSFITDQIAPASFGVSHAMDRPIWNYSITHGPTEEERQLMDDWIRDLRAFVHFEDGYVYGTAEPGEYKVMTHDGKIKVQNDPRWEELLQVMTIFSGLRKDSSL